MIEIKDLHKRFGKNRVLKGVDLTIPRGQITAVLGPNGSGKTTVLKSILGLVVPDQGLITYQGKSLDKGGNYRHQIGYLPQIARFPENLRVRELFDMIQDLRSAKTDITSLVENFKLQPFMRQRLRNLSGGTRQKVNTILTFMFDCELYILDEPTAGLDPVAMIKLKELINKRQEQGSTFLLTTHIMSLVEELADHIIFLLDGRIHYHGPLEDLKSLHGEANLERAIARILESNGSDGSTKSKSPSHA